MKPCSMTLSSTTMRPLSSDGLMTATITGLSGLLRGCYGAVHFRQDLYVGAQSDREGTGRNPKA